MIPEPVRTKIARINLAPGDQPHLVLESLLAAALPVASVRTVGELCYATLTEGMSRSERAAVRVAIRGEIKPGSYQLPAIPTLQGQLDAALARLDSLEARI